LIEVYMVIDSFACTCGNRFGNFRGPMLYYLLLFPSACLLLMVGLFAPHTACMSRRHGQMTCALAMAVLLGGYFIPAGAYLLTDPAAPTPPTAADTAAATAATREVVLAATNDSIFFLVTLVAAMSCASLVAMAVAVPLALHAVISLLFTALYTGYLAVVMERKYGSLPAAAIPGCLLVYLISLYIAHLLQSSSRQQFLVRIYAQHERDTRIEQLVSEKERLDYERAIAVQKQRCPPRNASFPPDPDGGSEAHSHGQMPHEAHHQHYMGAAPPSTYGTFSELAELDIECVDRDACSV